MRSVMRTETVKKVEIDVLDLFKVLEIDPKKYELHEVRLGVGNVNCVSRGASLILNLVERPYETGK